jgi:hypothetical protein
MEEYHEDLIVGMPNIADLEPAMGFSQSIPVRSVCSRQVRGLAVSRFGYRHSEVAGPPSSTPLFTVKSGRGGSRSVAGARPRAPGTRWLLNFTCRST